MISGGSTQLPLEDAVDEIVDETAEAESEY